MEVKDLHSAPANSEEVSRTVCCVNGKLCGSALAGEEPDSQVVCRVGRGREGAVVSVRVTGNRRIYGK